MFTNAEGFSNSFESVDANHTDILFLGSSHTAGLFLPLNENVSTLLNEHFPELTTYNISMPGHNPYRIVKDLPSAVSVYKPADLIIAEIENIDLEENIMQQVLDGTYEKVPSYDHGLVYHVQNLFPALLNIRKQGQNWIDQSADTADSDMEYVEVGTVISEESSGTVLHDFLGCAKSSCGDTPLILVYHPSLSIDADGNLITSDDKEVLDQFRKTCQSLEIIFVDLTEDYKELYTEEHKLPHGFSNTGLGVGHLNADGHRVMAERLCRIIEDLGYDAD